MSPGTVRSRVICHGHVHGVFFRDSCRRAATNLHVSGWVRNRRDRTVEAVFEGPPADVAAMLDWCRKGPPTATVTRIEVHDEPVEGLQGFEIRPTV